MLFESGSKRQAALFEGLPESGNGVPNQIFVKHLSPLLGGNPVFCRKDGLIDGTILKSAYGFYGFVEVIAPAFGQKKTPLCVAPVVHGDLFRQFAGPGGKFFGLAPTLDQGIDVVPRAAFYKNEMGIGKQGVQIRHAQAVLVVFIYKARFAGVGIEVAGGCVTILLAGILSIQGMGVPVLVGQGVRVHPEIMGFALQCSKFRRF